MTTLRSRIVIRRLRILTAKSTTWSKIDGCEISCRNTLERLDVVSHESRLPTASTRHSMFDSISMKQRNRSARGASRLLYNDEWNWKLMQSQLRSLLLCALSAGIDCMHRPGARVPKTLGRKLWQRWVHATTTFIRFQLPYVCELLFTIPLCWNRNAFLFWFSRSRQTCTAQHLHWLCAPLFFFFFLSFARYRSFFSTFQRNSCFCARLEFRNESHFVHIICKINYLETWATALRLTCMRSSKWSSKKLNFLLRAMRLSKPNPIVK